MRKWKFGQKRVKAFIIVFIAFISIISISYAVGGRNNSKKNILVGTSKPINNLKESEQTNVNQSNETKVPVSNLDNQVSGGNDHKNTKEAYLTFDDGPAPSTTPKILDVLKSYNAKATFFVVGKMANEHKDLILREKNEGHAIANHSYTHDYNFLYSDPKNFVDDINECNDILKGIINGYDMKLVRFPGGSFGKAREPYRQAITAAGYHYIDWNALNGDAEEKGVLPVDKLVENVRKTAKHPTHLVVLMHDAAAKTTTPEALPKIIEYLKSKGYVFKTLE